MRYLQAKAMLYKCDICKRTEASADGIPVCKEGHHGESMTSEPETESMNKIISDLFNRHWAGGDTLASIDNMRAQLHKSITNQLEGFWSGSSAYQIMTKGGFIIDAKTGKKELTEFGRFFMSSME
jgi:hypothetical protein